MSKSATPKWAVVATWRRYALFVTKVEADSALVDWRHARQAEGMKVTGSKGVGYRAAGASVYGPEGYQAAHVIKLADHPLCYIGVTSSNVERLREMEADPENSQFERYAEAAKAKSEEWSRVEALG